MTLLLTIIAFSAAIAIAPPIILFGLEVGFACVVRRGIARPLVAPPPRTAILIPAHNEEAGLGRMLRSLQGTLQHQERVIVVADNCSDRTAEVARGCNVEVLERHNLEQRGKGWALDYGVRHLADNPPEVLVILDADCTVGTDTVARLANEARLREGPVQGRYLCFAPNTGEPKAAISALAFQFKNQIRPLGLATLGGPAYLTGSGFALPWNLVQKAPWGSGNLVEDMQLGLDFAVAGHPPAYLDAVEILSPLPTENAAANKQRTRWEHGHLATMLGQCPRLIAAGVRERRGELLLLALDLAIPPLALLVTAWCVVCMLAIVSGYFTSVWAPALVSVAEGVFLFATVFAGWLVFGRRTIPFTTFFRIPGYVLGKLSIYRKFVTQRQAEWVRTERAAAP